MIREGYSPRRGLLDDAESCFFVSSLRRAEHIFRRAEHICHQSVQRFRHARSTALGLGLGSLNIAFALTPLQTDRMTVVQHLIDECSRSQLFSSAGTRDW